MAITPPKWMTEHISSTSQQVHNGTCNVPALKVKEAMCQMYKNEGTVWIVLVDRNRFQEPAVTRIIHAKGGKEQVAWCRWDICT